LLSHLSTIVDFHGLYMMTASSIINNPIKDHDYEAYFYVISEDDNKGNSLIWAIDKMGDILTQDREYPDYKVYILFDLFDAKDKLSKTPELAAVKIELDKKLITQYMFTRSNINQFPYQYTDTIDFKNKILQNVGWEHDK